MLVVAVAAVTHEGLAVREEVGMALAAQSTRLLVLQILAAAVAVVLKQLR